MACMSNSPLLVEVMMVEVLVFRDEVRRRSHMVSGDVALQLSILMHAAKNGVGSKRGAQLSARIEVGGYVG